MTEQNKEQVKTYGNWKGDLDEYLNIGDLVDEEMVDYAINEIWPATMTSDLVQMGEAANHVGGRATYPTFYRTPEGWRYGGDCYRGMSTPPAKAAGIDSDQTA